MRGARPDPAPTSYASPRPTLRAEAIRGVLDCRTCPGDGSCTGCDAIALDTSHLTFLARVARRLERPGLHRGELLFRLVNVTACYRSDRLVTAEVVYEHEIDPGADTGSRVLDELGVGSLPDGADWCNLIGHATGQRAQHLTEAAMRIHRDQQRDCLLLGNALALADERSAYLVTNDEDLLVSGRRLIEHLRSTGDSPSSRFMVVHSVSLMSSLVRCEAISRDVMEAALHAEWADVTERSMNTRRRRKKQERLLAAARQLNVEMPNSDRPFDDSDLFADFLRRVDDHGS